MTQGADITIEELEARTGEVIGVSPWRVVSQADIDLFAQVTEDHQFIHIDPLRAAAETSFGGSIAHGFLTLSLLSTLRRAAVPDIAGRTMTINYGFDRLRFVTPVRSGAHIRGRFTLLGIEARPSGGRMLRYGSVIEIDGVEKPALTAEWLTLVMMA